VTTPPLGELEACVVDASVLVKLFLPEDRSDAAEDLMEGIFDGRGLVRALPSFVYVECASVFWRWVRQSRLTPRRAELYLRRLLAFALDVRPLEFAARDGLHLALTYDISVYDATYLALADLLGDGAAIHSVDRDRHALNAQERAFRARFPTTVVQYHHADFTRSLDLPPLDGIVMANSLHFARHKDPVLQLVRSYLRPGGRLLLVEYSTDRGNMWVPFPLSYNTWEALARQNGFTQTQLLATVPSRYFGGMYSAMSVRDA